MLDKLLASEGLVCAAILEKEYFRHRFFDDAHTAHEYLMSMDRQGHTVYLAQATFQTPENRKGGNVQAIKSFWLDIDVGEKWPLKSQQEAAEALKRFITATGLPFPAVTNSGYGLYAHWFLEESLSPAKWRAIASFMKKLVQMLEPGLAADSSRTSDASSVLRPLGSHNRKDPENPREVRLLRDADPVPVLAFVQALQKACKKHGVELVQPKAQVANYDGLNSEFDMPSEPSDPDQVAHKCAQVADFRDRRGNVPEPFWYGMIGLLRYTTAGNIKVHEWSAGHPDYTPEATDRKIQQHVEAGVGPTTCAKFAELNPGGCEGCPFANKITSPIVLGKPEPAPLPAPAAPSGEEIPEPPGLFRRSKDGLYVKLDGVYTKFYPYDFFPVQTSKDQSLGYEVITWRHWLPHEGWQDFTMRSALLADARSFFMALMDNHVHVIGQKEQNMMKAYASGYVAELKKHRKMSTLYNQMGWRKVDDGHVFVLGEQVITRDGVSHAGMANNVPTAAKAFHTAGELQPWVNATKLFAIEGMEPFAFGFLASGFAGPLMKFTGFEGAMVSMLGDSGAGKSMVSKWGLSVYGQHSELVMLKDDTRNGLVSRLGVYNSLPMVVDEMTNIDPNELSDLVYRVTQGRDKVRLSERSKEKDNLNHWQTIAVVTCNAPGIIEKLTYAKNDASAEINRVFEYQVDMHPKLTQRLATALYNVFTSNYGHAGVEFIKHVVATQDEHAEKISNLVLRIQEKANCRPEERYWVAVIAATIYGGLLAKRLGLIQFELAPVMAWACEQLEGMRSVKSDQHRSNDAPAILAEFIDAHSNGRLVVDVKGKSNAHRVVVVVKEPRAPLCIRQELGDGDVNSLYIARRVLSDWLGRKGISYTAFKKSLSKQGVLLNDSRRKTLGAGTEFTGAATPCWTINLEHEALAESGIRKALLKEVHGELAG